MFSVVMMDIDWFKQVNDQYGHDAGDRVLASFAERIRSRIKRTDVFVRWGGEEFVLICRGCGREEAGRMAERLRREVERADLLSRGALPAAWALPSGTGTAIRRRS